RDLRLLPHSQASSRLWIASSACSAFLLRQCASDRAERTWPALAAAFTDQENRLVGTEGNALALRFAGPGQVNPDWLASVSCDEVADTKKPQALVRTDRDPIAVR